MVGSEVILVFKVREAQNLGIKKLLYLVPLSVGLPRASKALLSAPSLG